MSPSASRIFKAVVGLSGLGSLAASFLLTRARREEVVRVDPPSARIEADSRRGQVDSSFRITNDTGWELEFGTPTTTCGCTVASLRSLRLKPGQAVDVALKADVPRTGEKRVEVRVPYRHALGAADDAFTDLVFRLTLVGVTAVPFVSAGPEAVAFGESSSEPPRTEVIIETHEAPGTPAWIDDVQSDIQGLQVAGEIETEYEIPPGLVVRRYRYQLEFDRPVAPGPITGELRFRSRRSGDVLLTLPVRGSVLPPVYSRPSRLFAHCSGTDKELRLRFSVYHREDDADPAALELAEPRPPMRVVEKSRVQGRCDYELIVDPVPSGGLDTELKFQEKHGGDPVLEIPVDVIVEP